MQKSVVDLLKLVGGNSGGDSSPEPEETVEPQARQPVENTISIPSRNRQVVVARPQARTGTQAAPERGWRDHMGRSLHGHRSQYD